MPTATAFKTLKSTDYTITQFPAYSPYSYTYVSGSTSNSDDVQIFYAHQFPTQSTELRTEDFEQELFDSIVQVFYSPAAVTSYGISTTSYRPTSSAYVVNITQDLFGEKIVPGTFSIKVGTSQSYDDGKGNLIVSSSGQSGVVGIIFYDKGVALFKPTSSTDLITAVGGITTNGVCIVQNTSVQINFTSSVKVDEHLIRAQIYPTEFNYSVYNPSVSQSIFGNSNNVRPLQLMQSGTLAPYVTSIGLYNANSELIAIAKLSTPIQRSLDTTQTFIIKFDTYY
jgi:hypothetical protein